jgi:hypothetical protein
MRVDDTSLGRRDRELSFTASMLTCIHTICVLVFCCPSACTDCWDCNTAATHAADAKSAVCVSLAIRIASFVEISRANADSIPSRKQDLAGSQVVLGVLLPITAQGLIGRCL